MWLSMSLIVSSCCLIFLTVIFLNRFRIWHAAVPRYYLDSGSPPSSLTRATLHKQETHLNFSNYLQLGRHYLSQVSSAVGTCQSQNLSIFGETLPLTSNQNISEQNYSNSRDPKHSANYWHHHWHSLNVTTTEMSPKYHSPQLSFGFPPWTPNRGLTCNVKDELKTRRGFRCYFWQKRTSADTL